MDPRTRTSTHARNEPPPAPRPGGADISPGTLAIAAIASAVATFVTSQIWAGGTLWAAAASPVIVALVREGLARPAEKVRTVRMTRLGREVDVEVPETVAEGLEEEHPPEGRTGEMGPVRVYGGASRTKRWTPRRIRIAVITGVLAFVIVALAYTVPELISGSSLGDGGGQRTTLFGGTPRKRSTTEEKPSATPTPGAKRTPTPTATPTASPTATPSPTPTPTATPGARATPPLGAAPPAPSPAPSAAPSPTP